MCIVKCIGSFKLSNKGLLPVSGPHYRCSVYFQHWLPFFSLAHFHFDVRSLIAVSAHVIWVAMPHPPPLISYFSRIPLCLTYLKVLKGHDDHVITCLQFCGNRIVSGSDDNTLKVWSAVTGKVSLTTFLLFLFIYLSHYLFFQHFRRSLVHSLSCSMA